MKHEDLLGNKLE